MKIAYDAHHGQVDYNGIPYIFHPLHLAEQMQDEVSCCAALLHDVAEDTTVTLEMLAAEFPQEVIAVLRLLTHEKDTDYFDYVRAIKENPIARKVKLADLAHNSDQSRLSGSNLTEERKARLRVKYETAWKILTEA
jgi:(p)ppGpp synthase/HD superfamily hydrolase